MTDSSRLPEYPDYVADIVTEAVGRIGDIAFVGQNFPPDYRGKVMGAIKGALFGMLREIELEKKALEAESGERS